MNLEPYQHLLSTDISDAMPAGFAMDMGIRSLCTPSPQLMGFAYTVRCENRSNTYFHDAIYSAPTGAIVVAEADANDYAVAGGNVCAVAQENGVAGFIIDGVARDLGEIRSLAFPVYARGVFPKPGDKIKAGESTISIVCGGVTVNTGDLIVADEEGIAVVPAVDVERVLASALEKQKKADIEPLADWRDKHQKKIQQVLDS
jgi:regulator of RNase E activity RraA